jgi:hypothetical protein
VLRSPCALLAQAFPNAFQRRARVVHDIAGRLDLFARVSGFDLERGGRAARGLEDWERSGCPPDGGARLVHRIEEGGEREEAKRLERAPFDGEGRKNLGRSLEARSGNSPWDVTNRIVSVVAASSCATFWASVDGSRAARRSAPIGVRANPLTASTIRSNSRVRRALGCIRGNPRCYRTVRAER